MNRVIESLRIALRAIWSNKVRSFLTMLGIIIGVFAIVLLTGIGQGVKKEVTKQVEALGPNLLIILPGKLSAGSAPVGMVGSSSLTEEDVTSLKKIDGVAAVSPISIVAKPISYQGKPAEGVMAVGATPYVNEVLLNNVTVGATRGRDLTEEDLIKKNKVAVIFEETAKLIFGTEEAIGKKIMIGREEFEIVGTKKLKEGDSVFGQNEFGTMVFIPLSVAQDLSVSKEIHRIGVKISKVELVAEKKKEIKAVLLASHQGVEDFSVMSQEDLLSIFDQILKVMTAMLVGIASISLIVGGIGIMNIMLVAVAERTREIGIRKAVGASDFDILVQFLIETLVISILGAMIGAALAYLGAFIMNWKFGFAPDINFYSILLSAGFGVGIGVIFGLAPAIRASRLNPIDALRYE